MMMTTSSEHIKSKYNWQQNGRMLNIMPHSACVAPNGCMCGADLPAFPEWGGKQPGVPIGCLGLPEQGRTKGLYKVTPPLVKRVVKAQQPTQPQASVRD